MKKKQRDIVDGSGSPSNVETTPPTATNKKIVTLPTLVIGRSAADFEPAMGGQVIPSSPLT